MILYNPTVSGSLLVTGSLTTTGTITSQTLVVQTITSSIEFNTGSTRNGSLAANTHQFTGSVLVTGSQTVNGIITSNGGIIGNANDNYFGNYPSGDFWDIGNLGTTGTVYLEGRGASTNINSQYRAKGAGVHIWSYNAGSNEIMRTDSSGNVGIGTTAITAKLHVSGTTGGVFEVDGAAAVNALYVSSSGNVGINTNSPSSQLHIIGTSGNAFTDGLRIGRNVNPTTQFCVINQSGGEMNITVNDTSGNLTPQISFYRSTNGSSLTHSMTIDKNGNLGIGTTSIKSLLGSNTKLTVAGSGGTSFGSAGGSIGSAAGSGTGALNLGISINGLDGGMTLLFLASRNTAGGTSTASAVYIISFYYSDENFPVITYLGGTSNFVSFGSSGNNLTATNSLGGNNLYSWFANK